LGLTRQPRGPWPRGCLRLVARVCQVGPVGPVGARLRARPGPAAGLPTNHCKTKRLPDPEHEDDQVAPRLGLAELSGTRLRIAVGFGGVAQLICATGLLAAMGRLEAHVTPPMIAVVVVTLATALVLASRTPGARDGAPIDLATLRAPAAFALVPPIASLALALPWIATVAGAGLEAAVLDSVPVLAATTAPGVAIALLLEYSLWTVVARIAETQALARRAASSPLPRPALNPDHPTPPGLAGRLARLVAGLGLATGLLILANAVVEVGEPQTWLGRAETWIALLTATTIVAIAVLAAASAGLSPGRDVGELAARLDAIGWDEDPGDHAHAGPRLLARPVRVTSFDAVGELFRNLERLRAQLAEDFGSYERALERTHAVDAAKREFLAAVRQELRTPLDSILADANTLLASELSEAQAEDVRLIVAGGRQLRELIDDILDVSMIESGELQLRLASCDLAALVDELVDIHRAQLRGPEVELAIDRRGPIPAVLCDRKRVSQVLTNLLSNAIKFTERGSVRARIRHDPQRAQVCVEILDTGVGIAEAELATIFEEYRQVGARKRKLRGTGLGLAIARRIAEAHSGSLVARSELGRGSTFTLALPLRPPEPEPESTPESEVPA
jgi:signal transduction histidine kinase